MAHRIKQCNQYLDWLEQQKGQSLPDMEPPEEMLIRAKAMNSRSDVGIERNKLIQKACDMLWNRGMDKNGKKLKSKNAVHQYVSECMDKIVGVDMIRKIHNGEV